MTRPAAQHPNDVIPTGAEFASWPARGTRDVTVPVGPLGVRLARADDEVLASLRRQSAGAGTPGSRSRGLELEVLSSEREAYLSTEGARRLRLLAWRESGALVMASHHVALLVDEQIERGFLLLARRQGPDELDRSLQNALRVVAAWHLVRHRIGLLLHASCVVDGEGAVLFVGASGSGKSTAARAAAGRPVLADDVTVVERSAPRWVACAAPLFAEPAFPGRSSLGGRPLRLACELRHGRPRVEPLSPARGGALLLGSAPFLGSVGLSEAAGDLAADVSRSVPAASLHFEPDVGYWSAISTFLASREAGPAGTATANPRERRMPADLNDAATPKSREGLGEQLIDGEAVIVNAAGGEILVLNECGAVVWQMLDGAHDVASIVEAVCDAFEVDEETARSDVQAFLRTLREHDALEG